MYKKIHPFLVFQFHISPIILGWFCFSVTWQLRSLVKISREVSEAISNGGAVVALESTIISHGLFSQPIAIVLCWFLWNLRSWSHLNMVYILKRGILRDALPSKSANRKRSWVNCESEWSNPCNNSYLEWRTLHRWESLICFIKKNQQIFLSLFVEDRWMLIDVVYRSEWGRARTSCISGKKCPKDCRQGHSTCCES